MKNYWIYEIDDNGKMVRMIGKTSSKQIADKLAAKLPYVMVIAVKEISGK